MARRVFLGSAWVTIALGLSTPANAQSDPADLHPDVVVTASRTGETAATSVTTVGADEIDRLRPTTLLDVLDRIPGVRATSTGGIGGGSFVSIRGGEPNFTAVLIDGIRVNDPTNSRGGAFDFSILDPLFVDRIEVHRDATSAVHGSDALSGVINVRLRQPRPGSVRARARFEGNTLGDFGAGVTLEQGWDRGGVLIGAGAFDSGDGNPGSSLRRRNAAIRLNGRAGRVELSALGLYAHSRREAFPEDAGGPVLAVNRDRGSAGDDLLLASTTARARFGKLSAGLSLSLSSQRGESQTPAIPAGALSAVPEIHADNRFNRFEAIVYATRAAGALTATVGAAWLDESGRSIGEIDLGFPLPVAFSLDRRTVSGFAEGTLDLTADVNVAAAVRYDEIDHHGGETTGRMSVSWRPGPAGLWLFAMQSEGFKLPSLYALGHPFVGNPMLRSERSQTREMGVTWAPGSGRSLRVSLFETRFRDLVDFDASIFQLVNRANARARGFELDGTWALGTAISLQGSINHVRIRSEQPLRGRPAWFGFASAAWRASDRLEVSGGIRFNGDSFDSSVPTGLITLGGRVETDAALRLKLSHGLSVVLAVRNLLDDRSWETVGYPAPRRSLRISLTTAFGG